MSTGPNAYPFFERETIEWPYDLYRRMRREAPVCRLIEPGTDRAIYMVTPYDLVQYVFRTPEDYSNRHAPILFAGATHNPEAEAILAQGWPEMDTFDSDPPGHNRYRVLANKAFSSAAIGRLTGFIQSIVDDLIDDFIEEGDCDYHHRFAVPLPIYAIIGILGVGPDMRDKFHAWSDAFGVFMSHLAPPEEEIAAARLIVEFQRYVRDLITERRARPQDDIISALIDARGDTDEARFNDNELLSMIRQFMLAGSETSRNSLTAGLGLLLRHPAQLDELRREPFKVAAAVDEMLRYHTPVGGIWRIVRRDHELAGVPLRTGDIVMIRMDSANHDETVFDDPDRFDINRANLRLSLHFGHGIHFCLGAMLARKELMEAFPRLLARLKDIEIVEDRTDLRYQPGILLRAPRALHIKFAPGPRLGGDARRSAGAGG